MKKRIICGFILAVIAVGTVGCRKDENDKLLEESENAVLQIYEAEDEEISGKNSALVNLKDVYKSRYTFEVWEADGVEAPQGILCSEEDILISDGENDCLILCDYEGNVIKSIGMTGNGKTEFINPGAIAAYNDEIYVIDRGNQRIQIFDKDLNYIDEIKLKDTRSSDPDYVPAMLAVNEEGVYVSGYSLNDPVVDKYTGGERTEIGENFLGTVSVHDGQVYFINSMVRFYDKKEKTFGAVTSGPEYLMSIKGNELVRQQELPNGFGISDFIMDDDGIVCISNTGCSVYRLGPDGQYEETIANIEELNNEEYPKISKGQQKEYYIAMPKAKKILRCYIDTES